MLRNGKEESFLWTRRKKDYDFEEDKKLLSVFHKLRNYPGGIVFNYDMEKLLKSYESALFYPEQFLIVTDQAGGYILKNEKCPSELAVMFSGALDEGKDTINLQGEKYRFIEQEYDSLHLRLITAVPEQLFYQASLEHMQTTIFSLSLILLFSIFLAWIISVNDYSHLSQIIQWFELAAAKKPLPESQTKDMYSQILQNIIQMFLKNDYLEIRLSEEKFKKQVAELQALQYQINPHFLFNTLQTIRYEILDETGKDDGCAERMVGNLADIMRYSLDSGEKKVALFALIPDNDSSFNFLVSILYTQLFQQLFYAADHIHGGSLPVPVHFLMDEFANVSLPDDFDKILSVMRSRGVSVSIILQNLAQLKALFEKQWESIVGNCDEFLYLGGNEQSTHKYVSELLGKETIDTNTFGKSTGRSGNYSTNYQISGRELLTPDEVRMLDNQYAILFIRGERPVMDFKYDILKHPNVALTTDGKASAYKHGEVTIKHSSISVLSIDPEELPEESYGETNYELLSDEDFEVNKNLF